MQPDRFWLLFYCYSVFVLNGASDIVVSTYRYRKMGSPCSSVNWFSFNPTDGFISFDKDYALRLVGGGCCQHSSYSPEGIICSRVGTSSYSLNVTYSLSTIIWTTLDNELSTTNISLVAFGFHVVSNCGVAFTYFEGVA